MALLLICVVLLESLGFEVADLGSIHGLSVHVIMDMATLTGTTARGYVPVLDPADIANVAAGAPCACRGPATHGH